MSEGNEGKRSKTGKKNGNQPKKPYSPPVLIEYGNIRKFTRTTTQGTMGDGGQSPRNRMTCVSTVSALEEHRLLLEDGICQRAFKRAILATVRPGDVVLDLGTGSGIHAIFSCQAGAKRVYAIESEPVIELARTAAKQNGFDHRIQYIFGSSMELDLPEKVDVVITNTGFLGTLECMPDAAQRFLKQGGRLIPGQLGLCFALVSSTEFYARNIDCWTRKKCGIDFTSFRSYAVNKIWWNKVSSRSFLTKLKTVPAIDLMQPSSCGHRWSFNLTAERSGICHGIGAYYDLRLSDRVKLSTKPPLRLAKELWGQPFLPLSQPIKLLQGQKVGIEIGFFPSVNPYDPFWTWTVRTGDVAFEQNTLEGTPLGRELVAKLN